MTEKTIPLKELFDKKIKEHWFSGPNKKNGEKIKKAIETGFLNTRKIPCSNCKQGFTYRYRYFNEKQERKTLSSTDFLKLRDKVKKKNLKWEVHDHNEALETARKVGLPLIDLK